MATKRTNSKRTTIKSTDDLPGTHLPPRGVPNRPPQRSNYIAARYLNAEPMNRTAIKPPLRSPSKNRTGHILQIFQWKYIPGEKLAGLPKSQSSVISATASLARRTGLVDYEVMKAIVISR